MSAPLRRGRARTRASAKSAGTRHESAVAGYLAEHVDDRIERRRQSGAKDRGDIAGLRVHGQRMVIECKNTSTVSVGPHLVETETERGNDDALCAAVVYKRHGRSAPGDAVVVMSLADLVALLVGERPLVP